MEKNRTSEINILVAQAVQDVCCKSINNNLTEAESDYYMMSVIQSLVTGMAKGAYSIMEEAYQKSTEK